MKSKLSILLNAILAFSLLSSPLWAMNEKKESKQGMAKRTPTTVTKESSPAGGATSSSSLSKRRRVDKKQETAAAVSAPGPFSQKSRLALLAHPLRAGVIFSFLPFDAAIALGYTCKSFQDYLYSQPVDNFEPALSLKESIECHKTYGQLIASKSLDAKMHLAVFLLHKGDGNLAATVAKKQLELMKHDSVGELNTVLCMGDHGFEELADTPLVWNEKRNRKKCRVSKTLGQYCNGIQFFALNTGKGLQLHKFNPLKDTSIGLWSNQITMIRQEFYGVFSKVKNSILKEKGAQDAWVSACRLLQAPEIDQVPPFERNQAILMLGRHMAESSPIDCLSYALAKKPVSDEEICKKLTELSKDPKAYSKHREGAIKYLSQIKNKEDKGELRNPLSLEDVNHNLLLELVKHKDPFLIGIIVDYIMNQATQTSAKEIWRDKICGTLEKIVTGNSKSPDITTGWYAEIAKKKLGELKKSKGALN